MVRLFNLLTRNGWRWTGSENIDATNYEMDILSGYTVHCIARVADDKGQLDISGHYGVLWIDCTYECEPPYSVGDMQDMLRGIEYAEDNLLRIGVPFAPDRKFLGRNAENKKRRNDSLRKKYGLPEAEEKWAKGIDI